MLSTGYSFLRFVRGEGRMKQRGWIRERKEKEIHVVRARKRERERDEEREQLTGTFCRFFNEILECFDRQ